MLATITPGKKPKQASRNLTQEIEGCRCRILCHFGSSASASCAGSQSRWLNHTFACAVHRCLLDGIPGVRLPGSAVSPLQPLENQSLGWGIRCHSCTWREGLAPSWKAELRGSSSPRGLPGNQSSLSTNGSYFNSCATFVSRTPLNRWS